MAPLWYPTAHTNPGCSAGHGGGAEPRTKAVTGNGASL